MRCDPSNGYILLYTCGPGTNSFSHASVYLVKEKVLSLVLINEHVHVWKSWWGHASSTAGVRTWLNSNMQENSTHHQTRCSSIWLCGHSTNMSTNGMTAMVRPLQNLSFSSPTQLCHDLLKYSLVLHLFLIGTWLGSWGENTHVAVNKVMKWWSQHWKKWLALLNSPSINDDHKCQHISLLVLWPSHSCMSS